MDACEFAVPALYQLVKNLFFVKNCVLCIFVSTNWFKIAISRPNTVIYNEPYGVDSEKVVFLVNFSL